MIKMLYQSDIMNNSDIYSLFYYYYFISFSAYAPIRDFRTEPCFYTPRVGTFGLFFPQKNNSRDPVVCEVLIPGEISFSKCVALVEIRFVVHGP